MVERKLFHEVWEDFGEDGESLPALILAGPRGDGARRQLGPKARLLAKISAGNHFEAMTIYYGLMGWGGDTSNQPWDSQLYPEEWLREQTQAEESKA